MSNINDLINNSVDIIFDKINQKVNSIMNNTANVEEASNKICKYVTSTLTMESKGLLSTVVSFLSKTTLGGSLFTDTKNANRFYDLDLSSHMYEKYNFNVDASFNYKEAHIQMVAVGASTSVILLSAISQAMSIPVGLVIAAALYPLTVSIMKSKNKSTFKKSVITYLYELKRQILIWLENVINYYELKVNDLKEALNSEVGTR
jgi:subtilase family serine protease